MKDAGGLNKNSSTLSIIHWMHIPYKDSPFKDSAY